MAKHGKKYPKPIKIEAPVAPVTVTDSQSCENCSNGVGGSSKKASDGMPILYTCPFSKNSRFYDYKCPEWKS